VVDGTKINVPKFPNIVSDEQWIEAQIRMLSDIGAERTLTLMRRELHDAVGMKVAVISYEGWVDESLNIIEKQGPQIFFRNVLSSLRPKESVLKLISTEVQFENVTPFLLRALVLDPEEIYRVTPETFEQLICERLDKMGFEVRRVGKNAYHKDGGVDIFAWPRVAPFSFLMAVQAKHHRSPKHTTGSSEVRDLLGVVQAHSFNAGILVTNTTFTPDAQWWTDKQPHLIRLREIEDIQRWLRNDFLKELEWREIPTTIELCPGVTIELPKLR